MLQQESSEAFVRHNIEQPACGSMRGTDNSHLSFLPEKCHSAVRQRGKIVGTFHEDLVHGVQCVANVDVRPLLMESDVREALMMENNKRPASSSMPDIVECKRLKQEDHIQLYPQIHDFKDVRECPTRTCEQSFNSLAYEIEESEDEGVDSPVHCSFEDDLWPASFHRSKGLLHTRKPVPIGPNHQAELPECMPFDRKSNSIGNKVFSAPPHISDAHTEEDESYKWIRNYVMPMPDTDSLSSMLKHACCKVCCDCVDQDSIDCVRKHVREAREKLKASIGADTFKELGFYDMGEEVAARWTEDEEHLFQAVVSSNPASLRRNFWDELPLAFPSKSSKELVSYYFNVFMLRKRAEQNRFDPMNVDSDDDEWEVGGGGEFVIKQRTEEHFPIESLSDQDDGACNQVPPGRNLYEDYDADAQDDSCTSFEAGVEDWRPTDIGEDHNYRNNRFCSVAEHRYFGDNCDTKVWEIGFTDGWEKHDFLSTNSVIEEVFGKGSCENGSDAAGQDII